MYGKSNVETYITTCKQIANVETQTGALCQSGEVGWGGGQDGGSGSMGYMCTYGCFMLRFDRKQQNSVKQLSFNKNVN